MGPEVRVVAARQTRTVGFDLFDSRLDGEIEDSALSFELLFTALYH